MVVFGTIVAIVFGLLFGSFGSVILSRWGDAATRKQASSILRGRSECPHCKHRLQAWDLVPLFSFLFQGGKCRYCRKKISWLYPILELGTAVIFWLIYFYGSEFALGELVFWLLTGWILWLLLVYDVLRYEVHIPLVALGSLLVVGAIWWGFFDIGILWTGIWFFVFFLFMYWLAKFIVRIKYGLEEEWIGMGDVIIAPYLGLLLGVAMVDKVFVDQWMMFIFFLFVSAGIGLLRYLFQNKLFAKKASFLSKKMADQAVPFLPAMILWVVCVILAHQWFFSLFGF